MLKAIQSDLAIIQERDPAARGRIPGRSRLTRDPGGAARKCDDDGNPLEDAPND